MSAWRTPIAGDYALFEVDDTELRFLDCINVRGRKSPFRALIQPRRKTKGDHRLIICFVGKVTDLGAYVESMKRIVEHS